MQDARVYAANFIKTHADHMEFLRKRDKFELYSFGMDKEWHLIFVGYTEDFAKTYLVGVRWSRWIDDTSFGIDNAGWYYRIIKVQCG